MKSVRQQFVKDFSEELAQKIEQAAQMHENGVHDNRGSDPFKWSLCIAIGYQCFEIDGFRDYHGITEASYEEIKNWIKEKGKLDSHDGDVDYISLLTGAYNEYMSGEEA